MASYASGAASDGSRCVFGGGQNPTTVQNTMQYVNIGVYGNARDFGDLTQARAHTAGCSGD